jgi:predicted GIY-YIG superfamily endonuclease
MDIFWKSKLAKVKRPIAVALRDKLLPHMNPLGIDTANDKCIGNGIIQTQLFEAKQKYPKCVILAQIGSFYECFGVDAVMVLEHSDLNQSGSGSKAGTPLQSIQTLLNSLVKAQLCVAVFDQTGDDKDGLKMRTLTQIVTPANPIFFSCIKHNDTDSPNGLPIIGITSSTVYYANVELNSIRSSDLDPKDIACIAAIPAAAIFAIGPLPTIIDNSIQIGLGVHENPLLKFKQAIFDHMYVDMSSANTHISTCGSTLPAITAQTLGLTGHEMSLVDFVLGPKATATAREYMTQLLLRPPSLPTRLRIRECLQLLSTLTILPTPVCVNPRRLWSYIRNETLTILHVKSLYKAVQCVLKLSQLPLSDIICEEVGTCDLSQLSELNTLLSSMLAEDTKPHSLSLPKIDDFFARHEAAFTNSMSTPALYVKRDAVNQAFDTISRLIATIPCRAKATFSISHNQIVFPARCMSELTPYTVLPGDTKIISTALLSEACTEYVVACEEASACIRTELSRLATELAQIPSMKSVLFICLTYEALYHHTTHAVTKKWNMAKDSSVMKLKELKPFWMDFSVANDVDLCKTVILTGPNAYGKSSFIRAIAAATILHRTGLFAPLAAESECPLYDHVLLKIGASDRPSEALSCFATECVDLSLALQYTGKRLFMLDEIFRSTSSSEGTALAFALLSFLNDDPTVSCIFATHLHELFRIADLDVAYWCIELDPTNVHHRTFKVCDGQCSDSLALALAQDCGIPAKIINTAAALLHRTVNNVNTLPSIAELMTRVIESHGLTSPVISIKNGNAIPPSITTALYAITYDDCFYIGESACISQRLEQHAQKNIKQRKCVTVCSVDNKSTARSCETMLQQLCQSEGLSLLSATDASHIHF